MKTELSHIRLANTIMLILLVLSASAQDSIVKAKTIPPIPTQLDRSLNFVATVSYPAATPLISAKYYDGLGRESQSVSIETGIGKEDIAVINEYDSRGRLTSQSVPTTVPPDKHILNMDDVSNESFTLLSYNNQVSSRLTETKKPGRSWHNAQGVKEEIFFISDPGKYCYTLNNGYALGILATRYSSGELRMIVTTDEDNRITRRIIDRHNRVIRESKGPENAQLITDYVYDVAGNLRYIIPPVAMVEILKRAEQVFNPKLDSLFANYCYIFEYDEYNRLIYKKLPGIDPAYYCYSSDNLMAMSQDGNQRLKDEWTLYGYDSYYRPAFEAHVTRPGVTIDSMRIETAKRHVCFKYSPTSKPTCFGYKLSNLPDGFQLPDGIEYPENPIPGLTPETVTAVVYYDSYNFLDQFPQHRDSLAYTEVNGMDRRYAATETGEGMIAGGSVTGRAIRVLGDTTMLVSATYYDWNGQPVQEIESNHIGGYTRRFFCRDRDGKPVTIRQDLSTRWDSHTDVYRYTYDHARRPLSLTLQHDGDPARILQKWSYDDLGRLQSATLGDNVTTVNYQYNIQNSLTSISSTLFSQQLHYDKISPGMTRCLNGNIAGMTWNAPDNNSTLAHPLSQIKRGYAFKYDDYNRLANARYINSENSDVIPDISVYNPSRNYTSSYTYDLNGNPLTVSAKGLTDRRIGVGNKETLRFGTVKQMEITRHGNQIATVTDGQSVTTDIDRTLATVDNASAAAESDDGEAPDGLFVYDANGNIIHDGYRDVDISYNHLNRPVNIVYDSGTAGLRSLITNYDASGRKLSTLDRVSGFRVTPDYYCANYVYRGRVATKMLTPVGFLDLIDNEYFYYIKDYRENITAVVDDAGKCRQVNHYYPYGSLMGESWTDIDNDYRWEGKRLNSFAGLNHYDFETRDYDPVIPGFTSPDPLAEIDASNSPYTYCAANPIRNIDPSGMGWITATFENQTFYFFDERVKSKEDIDKYYVANESIEYLGEIAGITVNEKNGTPFFISLYSDGTFAINTEPINHEVNSSTYHIGSTQFTNMNTIATNWHGSYLGPRNPEIRKLDKSTPTIYSYAVPPSNQTDWEAYKHDIGYDKHGAIGIGGALFNCYTYEEDVELTFNLMRQGYSDSLQQTFWSQGAIFTFTLITAAKLPGYLIIKLTEK